MFDRKLIVPSEARKILRKIGWELEDDSILASATPDTITTARSQQVVVTPASLNAPQGGSIQPALNPQTQAQAQGLAPGQAGLEQPQVKAQGGSSK